MPNVTINGESQISYIILKEFHSSAHAIYDIREEQQQPQEVPYKFDIDIEADDIDSAKQIFMDYLHSLNDLGIAHHVGHLTYITRNTLQFEANFIKEDSPRDEFVIADLKILLNLLKLQTEKNNNITLEFKHKAIANKDFEQFTSINNNELLAPILIVAIQEQFKHVKNKSDSCSMQIQELLYKTNIPTIDNIQEIIYYANPLNPRAFETNLLYTICKTLLSFLTKWTGLNPNDVFMTNDQARVIYQTCKIHGLLKVSHEIERDEINYIRMVVKNSNDQETMLSKLID